MKVLMVIDSLRLGGAERVLATLGAAGPAAGFQTAVQVLSAPGSHRSVMEPVLEAAGVSTSYLSIRRLTDPRALPRLVRAIRRSGCDLVHAHLEDAATFVPLAARIANCPAVCSFHHVAVPLSRKEAAKERLAVAAANRGDRVVFVSHASLNSFARVYGGPRRSWSVIENGVDLESFIPEEVSLPPDMHIPAQAPVVTIVSALRWRKGHAVAVGAWPAICRRFPQARLLIVGDGPEREVLREQARRLGVTERVVFAGTRTDVAALIPASTLLALPSQHEALPTTLMEAAACGRPVIATDVDGVPEVVRDGETGLLVPFGDEDAFAAATIALLEDQSRRRAMGASARRLAEARFGADRWAKRLHALYRDVHAAHRAANADRASNARRAPAR